ncbi:MAG: dTDP-4-dehydrorhamnose 3,5-epimerase family protein [Thermodesulfovibrio sp.]|nr:dTDP-4-dehydrorhamnose 3,5-epimerase family protein [Thermodesulfovibrio sp.]
MKKIFEVKEQPLEGLKIIRWIPFEDKRGIFQKLFCGNSFKEFGWLKPIMQVNLSLNRKKGTVRGMHYQRPPYIEMKLIICLRGAIWDVALDLRKGSSSFLKWHAVELSENQPQGLLIPEGFAHGFQTLTDNVEILYIHSAPYMPEYEGGINPLDPRINIKWPLKIIEISDRDKGFPFIDDNFTGLEFMV